MTETYNVDFAAWAVLLGMVTPLVVSLIKSPGWPRWAKVSLAVVVSVATAVIKTGVETESGGLSIDMVVANFGLIWTMAQTTYLGLLNGTTLDHRLASLVEFPVEPGDPSGGPGGGD